MALNAQVLVSILAHETSSDGLGEVLRATPASHSFSLANGTGPGLANVAWSGSRTFTGTDTLTPSSLPDTRAGVPATVSITRVKVFYVRNPSTTAYLMISAPFITLGGSVARDEVIDVPPGGAILLTNPTHSLGNLTGMGGYNTTYTFSSGTSNHAYDIVLIGEGTVT